MRPLGVRIRSKDLSGYVHRTDEVISRMNNISDILTPTTKPIRPVTARQASLPSQLAPDQGVRADEIRLSERAREASPAAEQPFRADKVAEVRADIEVGLYSDEAIDKRLDAILPRLLEDIKNA